MIFIFAHETNFGQPDHTASPLLAVWHGAQLKPDGLLGDSIIQAPL